MCEIIRSADVSTFFSYSFMVKCWVLKAKDRPTFKELRSTIDRLLHSAAGYLELNMVLVPHNEDSDIAR